MEPTNLNRVSGGFRPSNERCHPLLILKILLRTVPLLVVTGVTTLHKRARKPRPYSMLCRQDGLGDRRGRLSHLLWHVFYYRAVREPPLRLNPPCPHPERVRDRFRKGELIPLTLISPSRGERIWRVIPLYPPP